MCKPSDGTSNKTESTEFEQKLNEQIHSKYFIKILNSTLFFTFQALMQLISL